MRSMHFLDAEGNLIYGVERKNDTLYLYSRLLRIQWDSGIRSSFRTGMKYFEFPMDSTFYGVDGRTSQRLNYGHHIHPPFMNLAKYEQMPDLRTYFPTEEYPVYDAKGRLISTRFKRFGSEYLHIHDFPPGEPEQVKAYQVRKGTFWNYRYEYYPSRDEPESESR